MSDFSKRIPGIVLCLAFAIPCWFAGSALPVVGGPIFGIVAGVIVGMIIQDKRRIDPGITWVSKKVLQAAVVLLGFGLNLHIIAQTGLQSLPIIVATITGSLLVAYILHKTCNIPAKIATLIGVGSSICGGSAIAATAPVIDADFDEIAQAMSVIFFFNFLAALLFPLLGASLGFSTTSGEAFGIFAGTAVNDTSSVTACAATWDALYGLGSETLDKAVTVKLVRTLAIIPITLCLAYWQMKKASAEGENKFSLKRAFPRFILFFILASLITTCATSFGVSASVFAPCKMLSKFMIIMAMFAIGCNTNIVKLVTTGAKPLGLGASCWTVIIAISLISQAALGIW